LDILASNVGSGDNQELKANLDTLRIDVGGTGKDFRHLKYDII
jgi:hypothetical protein